MPPELRDYYILQGKLLEWHYEMQSSVMGWAQYRDYKIVWDKNNPYMIYKDGDLLFEKSRSDLDKKGEGQDTYFQEVFVPEILCAIDQL